MKLSITDRSNGQTIEVEHDQLADTVAEWFFFAADETFDAISRLQNAWTPGSQNAHDQDALGTFLGLTVAPAA